MEAMPGGMCQSSWVFKRLMQEKNLRPQVLGQQGPHSDMKELGREGGRDGGKERWRVGA